MAGRYMFARTTTPDFVVKIHAARVGARQTAVVVYSLHMYGLRAMRYPGGSKGGDVLLPRGVACKILVLRR